MLWKIVLVFGLLMLTGCSNSERPEQCEKIYQGEIEHLKLSLATLDDKHSWSFKECYTECSSSCYIHVAHTALDNDYYGWLTMEGCTDFCRNN